MLRSLLFAELSVLYPPTPPRVLNPIPKNGKPALRKSIVLFNYKDGEKCISPDELGDLSGRGKS